MKQGFVLIALLTFGATTALAAENLAKEAVDGKIREGKSGTSNKNAEKQMKELEKDSGSTKASPTPKPSPAPKK